MTRSEIIVLIVATIVATGLTMWSERSKPTAPPVCAETVYVDWRTS